MSNVIQFPAGDDLQWHGVERALRQIFGEADVPLDMAPFITKRLRLALEDSPSVDVRGPIACRDSMEAIGAAYKSVLDHRMVALVAAYAELWSMGAR